VDEHNHPTHTALLLAGAGAWTGFASGLLGVGGGIVLVPLLSLLLPDLSPQAVIGTSLATMLPGSAISLLAHYRRGNVRTRAGLLLAAGGALGGALGALLSNRITPEAQQAAFVVAMLSLGTRLLLPRPAAMLVSPAR